MERDTLIVEHFDLPPVIMDVYNIIAYPEENPAAEENVTRIQNCLALVGAQ